MSATIQILCKCKKYNIATESFNIQKCAIRNQLALKVEYEYNLMNNFEKCDYEWLCFKVCDNFISDSCELFLQPKDCVYEDLQYRRTSNNLTIEQREEKIKNILMSIIDTLKPELLFLNISSDSTDTSFSLEELKIAKCKKIDTALYDYIYLDVDNIIINLDYLLKI